MKLISTLVTTALALAFASTLTACSSEESSATTGDPAAVALTGKDVAGHWVSQGCEAYPDGKGGMTYLTRDFTLTEKEWSLDLGLFGDAECSYPLFSSMIRGPFTMGELSTTVAGATEGTFAFETIDWTAHDQGLADTFTAAGCGTAPWELEKAQDVTGTGCIGVAHKKSECGQDYDVVAMDGDELFFGQRITDMCVEDGRPTALGPFGVLKQ